MAVEPGFEQIFPESSVWTALGNAIPQYAHVDFMTVIGTNTYISYSNVTTGERFWKIGTTEDITIPPEQWGIVDWVFEDALLTPDDVLPPQLSTVTQKEAAQCAVFYDNTLTIIANTSNTDPSAVAYGFDVNNNFVSDFQYPLVDENSNPIDLHKVRGVHVVQGNMLLFVESDTAGTVAVYTYTKPTSTQTPGTPPPKTLISPGMVEESATTEFHGAVTGSDGTVILFMTDKNDSVIAVKTNPGTSGLDLVGSTNVYKTNTQPLWASSTYRTYYVQYGELIAVFGIVVGTSVDVHANILIDNVTGVPDKNHSIITFSDNALSYGAVDPALIELKGIDKFGQPTSGINVRFKIRDMEEPFTASMPAIAEYSTGPFRDSSSVPLNNEVVVVADTLGVARAYFQPPAEGTGIETFAVDITAPV